MTAAIRSAIDWGELAPLRLRASVVADGVYAGGHRSARRGAGVEFGGHRPYTPGDDLRWLDRRSLLRHDHLLVRQFETETDRALSIAIDATASMGYRGSRSPAAKYAWAALIAAALARVAIAQGDSVAVTFFGGSQAVHNVPRGGGREQFERIVSALEAADPFGDADAQSNIVEDAVANVDRTSRRGSVVVVLSDLLDLPATATAAIAELALRRRALVVMQTLDEDELTLPFDGPTRMRSMEGQSVVETDTTETRSAYLQQLEQHNASWSEAIRKRGGKYLRATTSDDAVRAVRSILDNV